MGVRTLRYRHTIAWGLFGGPALPPEVDRLELARGAEWSYALVRDSGPALAMVNLRDAVRTMVLRGIFNGDAGPRRAEEEAKAVGEERAKRIGSRLVLLFEATGNTEVADERTIANAGTFHFGFDLADQKAIAAQHSKRHAAMHGALVLESTDALGIEQVARGTVLEELDGKPLFSLSIEMPPATLYVSRKLTQERATAVGGRFEWLLNAQSLERVVREIVRSNEHGSTRGDRFDAAWLAFEVFLNKHHAEATKSVFEHARAKLTPAGKDLIKHAEDLLKPKPTVANKFQALTHVLFPTQSSEAAADDLKRFNKVKDARDDVTHGNAIADADVPLEDAEFLVRKYVTGYITANFMP